MTNPYKARRILPPIPSGYPLDDVFSVLVPVARTNLIANPSLETNTTGWTAVGGSIARSATQQYHGAYSLAVTPTAGTSDGCYYGTVTLTSGQLYAVSAKIYGQAGVTYKISVATTGGADLAAYQFVATGRWQWVWIYWQEPTGAARRVYITKVNSSDTHVFYIDGAQVEAINAGETVSTYLDGDQQGLVPNQYPAPYGWNGTPHASTSYRTALTRSGGQVMRLKDYGFVLLAIVGLGLATPQNVTLDYAQLDGGQDVYTRKPARQFALVGQFRAGSYFELRENRSAVASVLDRDAAAIDQPLVLRHHLEDGCGNILSDETRLVCKYQGGMGGNTATISGEGISLQFQQQIPLVLSDRESGASLTVQQTIANANYAVIYTPSSGWAAIGTGGNAAVNSLFFGRADEYLYIGGGFTAFNGVANTRYIARYSLVTQTITAMGSGGAGGTTIYAMAQAPNGDMWVVGDFTSMGGAANSAVVAHWVAATSSWSGHTYPGGIAANCIAIDAAGNVYVSDNLNRVYQWNGAAWTLLGTANATIRGMTIGPDGNLYVAGQFTSIAAVAMTMIGRYTLAAAAPAWEALSGTSPTATTFNAIAFDTIGMLHVTMNGSGFHWRWNGAGFEQGVTFTGTSASAVTALANGDVYISGLFSTVAGVVYPDSVALIRGGTPRPLDIDLPGSAVVGAVAERPDGARALGFTTSGSAVASSQPSTLTNPGTARSYPTMTIKGPSSGTTRIFQITNRTTGKTIYMNYTIAAGETAILRFDPDNLSFTSDFQGNLLRTILPGSDTADFFLAPGSNTLSFYAAGATVTAIVAWRPRYASLDDVP